MSTRLSRTPTKAWAAVRCLVGVFIVICLTSFTRRCLQYTGADFSVASAILSASPVLLVGVVSPVVLRQRRLGLSAKAIFVVEVSLGIVVGIVLRMLRPDSLVLMSSVFFAAVLIAAMLLAYRLTKRLSIGRREELTAPSQQ
jgi:hypothetical protein